MSGVNFNDTTNQAGSGGGSSTWTTYTPTVTLNGGGTVPVYTTNIGRYITIGKLVRVEIELYGVTGSAGNGGSQIRIALPVAASTLFNASGSILPGGYGYNSPAPVESALWYQLSPGNAYVNIYAFNGSVSSVFSGTSQNGTANRSMALTFSYEID